MNDSSNPNVQPPRIPGVGDFVRGVGRLVAVQVIPPPPAPPPETDYIFEEITARVELRRQGKRLNSLGTFNDFYGLETSVSEAIKEAMAWCANNAVGPNSELEVVVLRIAAQRRFRLDAEKSDNFYDRRFKSFQNLDRGDTLGVPEPEETLAWTSRELEVGETEP